MKTTLLIVLMMVFNVGSQSCNKQKHQGDYPSCMEKLIKEFDNNQTCDKDVRVDKYIFQEKTVFVFEPGSCGADMTSAVYSNECKLLGHLGGIAGNTEINGESFSNAKLVATVWRK